jgi:hypothetical protein
MNEPLPDLSLPDDARTRRRGDANIAIAILGWVCLTSALLAFGRTTRSRLEDLDVLDAILASLTALLCGASVVLLMLRRKSGRVLASTTLALLGLNSIWVAVHLEAYLPLGFYRPGAEVIALARAVLFLALAGFVGHRAWDEHQMSKKASGSRKAA